MIQSGINTLIWTQKAQINSRILRKIDLARELVLNWHWRMDNKLTYETNFKDNTWKPLWRGVWLLIHEQNFQAQLKACAETFSKFRSHVARFPPQKHASNRSGMADKGTKHHIINFHKCVTVNSVETTLQSWLKPKYQYTRKSPSFIRRIKSSWTNARK